MINFYDFINILNEAPTPPPTTSTPPKNPTPPAGGTNSPEIGSPSNAPLGGPAGGIGGGIGSLGPGPVGGSSIGGPPELSPSGSMGSGKSGPVAVQKVKSIDVWSALEKLIKNNNGQ